VKTTSDLLVVRSDAYRVRDDWTVSTVRDHPPVVELDPDYFKLMGDFEPRFADGAPSLVEAERLTVEGDVTFGRDVKVRGEVRVVGPRRVADGEVLEG
jgi:UTP--glucose-1-phosphate uridylyltransferase